MAEIRANFSSGSDWDDSSDAAGSVAEGEVESKRTEEEEEKDEDPAGEEDDAEESEEILYCFSVQPRS